MRKLKMILAMTSMLTIGFALGACGQTAIAEQTYPLKIWCENRNGQMETWKIVDEETGVNYIVVGTSYSTKGHEYNGVCITPRLNADGSLYTSK